MTQRNTDPEIRTTTLINSRLREVAGALALLAGASCTAAPSGEVPAAVATPGG